MLQFRKNGADVTLYEKWCRIFRSDFMVQILQLRWFGSNKTAFTQQESQHFCAIPRGNIRTFHAISIRKEI